MSPCGLPEVQTCGPNHLEVHRLFNYFDIVWSGLLLVLNGPRPINDFRSAGILENADESRSRTRLGLGPVAGGRRTQKARNRKKHHEMHGESSETR